MDSDTDVDVEITMVMTIVSIFHPKIYFAKNSYFVGVSPVLARETTYLNFVTNHAKQKKLHSTKQKA